MLVIIYIPHEILDSKILTKSLFFDSDNLLTFTKLVKCIPEF